MSGHGWRARPAGEHPTEARTRLITDLDQRLDALNAAPLWTTGHALDAHARENA